MARTGHFHDETAQAGVPEGAAGPRLGMLMNWAGALISLGLVVGMSVWAVQLMIRDVSGVPVVQAIEGPMRVPPADPGGTQAPHQGLAVNRIAEGEEAQPVPDRLVLAPPPIELQPVRFETSSGSETVAPRPRPADSADGTAAPDRSGGTTTETMALIDRLLAEAQGLDPGEPRTGATQPPQPAADVIPASVPGVAASLRPTFRPARFVSSSTANSAAPPVVDIAASELPEGTRLVQLGAFDTPSTAREAWADLAARFPDYFAGRPRVIEQASSGGEAFFRLRAAGFDDLAGSRRFCAVLVAQGASCIPVTVR